MPSRRCRQLQSFRTAASNASRSSVVPGKMLGGHDPTPTYFTPGIAQRPWTNGCGSVADRVTTQGPSGDASNVTTALKERRRPMRGVKSSHTAASFVVGHALMRNICRGFYRVILPPHTSEWRHASVERMAVEGAAGGNTLLRRSRW